MSTERTVICVDNHTFTIERRAGIVQVTVTVGTMGISATLNELQAAQLAVALVESNRCKMHWRAGVVTKPGGASIPHGARCVRDKHDDSNHRFRTAAGDVVERGPEYARTIDGERAK